MVIFALFADILVHAYSDEVISCIRTLLENLTDDAMKKMFDHFLLFDKLYVCNIE